MRISRAMLGRILLLSATLFGGVSMTLDERVKGSERAITWKVSQEKKQLQIVGSATAEETTLLGSPDFVFSTFTYKGPVAEYTIEKTENVLTVKGVNEKGDRSLKTYNIGNEPWVQQFWYGLKPFLESSKKEYKFSIINPEDFSHVRMVAYKQKVVPLTIDNKTYDAQFVKVTLQGFQGMFWSAKVWYDARDHSFLKYEATKGPKTPLTTIERKHTL